MKEGGGYLRLAVSGLAWQCFDCVAQFNQVRTVTNEYEEKKGNNLNAGTKTKRQGRAANQEA